MRVRSVITLWVLISSTWDGDGSSLASLVTQQLVWSLPTTKLLAISVSSFPLGITVASLLIAPALCFRSDSLLGKSQYWSR